MVKTYLKEATEICILHVETPAVRLSHWAVKSYSLYFNTEGNTHTHRIIHNSLTHLMKSVNLNGGMNCKHVSYRWKKKLLAYFVRALCVTRQKPNR